MNIQLQKNLLRLKRSLLGGLAFASAAGLQASDWPQYRGPNHDGVASESIRTNWSETPPRQVWKVTLDPGLSSFAIGGGKAFTQVRRRLSGQEREFCVTLDAETGKELWAVPLDIADYPNGGVGFDDGPRSTPSIDGDRVFVLTSYLQLACLDSANGQAVWKKDLISEYGGFAIAWQNAASPLIVGDLVLVNANGRQNDKLLAFRKQDGTLVWRGQNGQNDGMTQASPVAATIGGVRQAIFFAQSGLVSVAPETGAVLWRYALRYNGTSVAASPVVAGDMVFSSRAYPGALSAAQAGAVVVKITPSGNSFSAGLVWSKVNQLMNHWCTPVHYNGYIYGMFGQDVLTFKCVELATGDEKWSVSGYGYGSVLVVDGKILAFSDRGDLVLIDPNPAAYTEIARLRAVDGKCWNVPAISNGRIYARSTTEAVSLDVAVPVPIARPRLKLEPSLASGNRLFSLSIGSEDGSPLDASRVPKIDVWATSDLSLGPAGWLKLNLSPVLNNGRLLLDDPESPTRPQRFFRVEERP